MVFAIRPRLLLEARLVLETWLVFKQMQSEPRLVLETRFVFETHLLLEEIRQLYSVHVKFIFVFNLIILLISNVYKNIIQLSLYMLHILTVLSREPAASV